MRIELQAALQAPQYLAALLEASVQGGTREDVRIRGIATDTAEVLPGDLFVALKGAHADGNDYVCQAIQKGAVAVLTEREAPNTADNALCFRCKSIEDALLAAAGKWRKLCAARVIAVTGSAGKSTTKEAIAAVLGNAPHNEGNYNSTLGMPMSVMSFPKSEFWVCELGINHVGEMEKMSSSLCPDIGVITNVGSAHIGLFGDFQTILQEKLKLCAGMGKGATLLVPLSLKKLGISAPLCHILSVGEGKEADLATENIAMDASGTRCDLHYAKGEITNLTWPIPGVVGSSVLGLAAAVGVLCGRTPLQIRAGLQSAAQAPMHVCVYSVGQMLFLQDCYNASPEACMAALESLRYLAQGRARIAVLGDMLELGAYSRFLHHTLGVSVYKTGVSYLFTYGALAADVAAGAKEAGMADDRIFSFAAGEELLLAKSVLSHVPPDAAVLLKGSRALKMERVAQELRRLL